MTHIVRTTLRPDQAVEVGDAEYLDLKRDGLLVDAPETPAAPAPAPKKTIPATIKEG